MPINQVRVQDLTNVSGTDGSVYDQIGGKQGEGIVTDLHGKYYTQTYRGNVFYVSTVAAGLAIPISSTTAPTVALWNPAGSGKNAELIRVTLGYASGTSVATPIGLMFALNAGNTVATGAVFTAFNRSVLNTNLFNGLLGAGDTSAMNASANGTITLTAAGTWLMTLFGESALIATTAMNPYAVTHEFDGTVIIPPGVAVWLAGTAATGALLTQTLMWAEVPI